MNIYKRIYTTLILLFLFLPFLAQADGIREENNNFKSKVIEILQVTEKTREDGTKFKQQDLKLLGLEGAWKDKEIIYKGVSDIEVANANFYRVGDRVYVEAHTDETGENTFYVADFIRSDQ